MLNREKSIDFHHYTWGGGRQFRGPEQSAPLRGGGHNCESYECTTLFERKRLKPREENIVPHKRKKKGLRENMRVKRFYQKKGKNSP